MSKKDELGKVKEEDSESLLVLGRPPEGTLGLLLCSFSPCTLLSLDTLHCNNSL
jgi:hypothetical protein